MKTFTRWLLAVLLVATPMLALVDLASANTELVPASRLVAPYWDIAGTRTTLLLLTNVSKTVDLLSILPGGNPTVQPRRAVHLEFYDKACSIQDTTMELSASDVDQYDIKTIATPSLPNNQGWVDIDVRAGDGQRAQDSIQCNVLLGVVVNADSANDFAVAYPMASSIGSSTGTPGITGEPLGGVGAPCSTTLVGSSIVTHNSGGSATAWGGYYEPFPSRVFVPFFFAEGGPAGMDSQLVVAAPADGNWFATFNVATLGCPGGDLACREGESPGQDLGTGTTLMSGSGALFFDGCENKESRSWGGHWVNGKLSSITSGSVTGLLGPKAIQELPWKHPGLSCHNQANFPSVDDDAAGSGAFVGWVDLPNSTSDSSATTRDLGTSIAQGAATRPRGLVGILIQNSTIGDKEGDVVRLWGDPADGGRNGVYSLVDFVSHTDLD